VIAALARVVAALPLAGLLLGLMAAFADCKTIPEAEE